jgi:hypothetical protein
MASLSDRYEVLGLLATGGMASVLYGRLKGPTGFAREVAIKRLHPHFASEPDFLQMFIDEAHICARLSHANIVSALDVIDTPPDLCLVMEYVHGAALDALLHAARTRSQAVPVPVAIALLSGVLHGLHAAHEARDESGGPLGIVHRDVSPSNVMVGQDGVARVLDFGIACAFSKVRSTPTGELKGKFAYMAPELLRGRPVDKRLDVYAAAVVLWETLAGRSLFGRQPSAAVIQDVLACAVSPPSHARPDISPELDAIVLRGLARDPDERFESAEAFAIALEQQCEVARQSDVSAWVRLLMGQALDSRALELRRLARERTASQSCVPGVLLAEGTLKEPFVPTLVNEVQGGASGRAAIARAPATRARARRWLTRAAALLVLGGVLQADAKYKSSAASSPAPEGATLRTVAIGTPTGPPRVEPLVTPEEPRTDTMMRQRDDMELSQSGSSVSDTRAAKRPMRRSKRAGTAVPVTRETADVRSAPATPRATESSVPVDCRQAFVLETVDGLVIKTFKPGCLN